MIIKWSLSLSQSLKKKKKKKEFFSLSFFFIYYEFIKGPPLDCITRDKNDKKKLKNKSALFLYVCYWPRFLRITLRDPL